MIWDPHTLLMVDPSLFLSLDNASLVREEAFKCDVNPLIDIHDKKLTLGGGATDVQMRLIHRVEGVYRLWYTLWGLHDKTQKYAGHAQGAMYAYAESTDGIYFKPVNLNQVEYQGSRKNNLIDFSIPEQPGARIGHFMVDPLDAEFPYKCVYYRPAKAAELEPGVLMRMTQDATKDYHFIWGIGKSRDGLHWLPPENKQNLINANPESARLFRAMNGAYVLSDQMVSSVEESSGREVKGWLSYDGETAYRIPGWMYEIPQHMARVYPEFAGVHFNNTRWIQPHIGLVTARKGPTILALTGFLYYAAVIETFAQQSEIGLAVSPTGAAFREVLPMMPFIPKGPRGSWDYGMACQSDIVEDGEQTRFYYTGNQVGNLGGNYAIGMAYIPRDRYGYVMIRGFRDHLPRPRSAQINLKPVTLPDKPQLTVNLSHLSSQAKVVMQISDEAGEAIKGFAFSDCKPIRTEGLRQPVRFGANRSHAILKGRKVHLSLRIEHDQCGFVGTDSPRIYAVQLQ